METEALSDLLKIGIPSIVALAGTASAVIISQLSNKHALTLEIHRYRIDRSREESTRRAKLLENIAIAVTKLHHYEAALGSIIFARQDTLICREPWNEEEIDLEGEAKQELLAAFHTHLQTNAHVLLLGEVDLGDAHDRYLRGVSEILTFEATGTIECGAELDSLIAQNVSNFNEVMSIVSKRYLPSEPLMDPTS